MPKIELLRHATPLSTAVLALLAGLQLAAGQELGPSLPEATEGRQLRFEAPSRVSACDRSDGPPDIARVDGTIQRGDRRRVPTRVRGMICCDLDKDGRSDLVTLQAEMLEAYRTTAQGAFSLSHGLVLDPPGKESGNTVAAQLVGIAPVRSDGTTEVLVVGGVRRQARKPEWAGFVASWRFTPELEESVTYHPLGRQPRAAAFADVDRDGVLDLVVVDSELANLSVLRAERRTRYGRPRSFSIGRPGQSVAAADLDGDVVHDLAILRDDGSVVVLIGDGRGTFAPPVVVLEPSNALATPHVVAGDLDGNGSTDLVLLLRTDQLMVLANDGRGRFAQRRYGIPFGFRVHELCCTDIDGDGCADLVIGREPTSLIILGGRDGLAFQSLELLVRGVAVCDLEGDRLSDLLILQVGYLVDAAGKREQECFPATLRRRR